MKRSRLKRTTGLARGARPRPLSSRRAAELSERATTRDLVFRRDRYLCQVMVKADEDAWTVSPCFGPLTPHHRRKASQGGAYSTENLVTVCAGHNDEVEANAMLAAWCNSVGLVVRRGDAEWGSLGAR